MKRMIALLFVVAFAELILVPVTSTVNDSFSNDIQLADGGVPIPPLPPNIFAASYSPIPL